MGSMYLHVSTRIISYAKMQKDAEPFCVFCDFCVQENVINLCVSKDTSRYVKIRGDFLCSVRSVCKRNEGVSWWTHPHLGI
jgi:hypothetical protein